MSSPLSPDQIASLAKQYSQFATTINDFLDNNDVPDPDYTDLRDAASQCATAAANLTIEAAVTQFSDSDAAFGSLSQVTTAANQAAFGIKKQAASIKRTLSIATGLLSLAAGLVSGSPATVVSAIASLHGTLWGS
ncbi:MAG: hypothetical protein WB615_00020 [Candidatus Tumulicola sp.]